ncbi:30S ribosomal protein S24e [Pyrolobus fumarii]|nr:30S ribosomal protein S24e [Pyrolobus fumarii]
MRDKYCEETRGKKLDLNLGEGYEVEVECDWYNKLIRRRELDLLIKHIGKPTPSRLQLRQAVANALNVDLKRVYVRSIQTEYGWGVTHAEVHIYDDPERARSFEPKHIRIRNATPEELEEMQKRGELE